MSETAEKADPALWDAVKAEITRGNKGGKAGQWSARKAQMAVQLYKHRGGGYVGEKPEDNHLVQWTEEEWGTKSGHDSGETGERYLPKAAREALSPAEYRRTTRKKRADTAKGRQFSAQPRDIAAKTAEARAGSSLEEMSRAALYAEARTRNLPGRSTMTKAELVKALQKKA